MTDTRKQRDYGKLVAKQDDEYIILDYIFEDKNFKGATGTRLRPVPKSEYDERMSPEYQREYMRELWEMAVQEGRTDDGLDDWIEYQDLGEDWVFDLSYMHEYWPQIRALGYSEEDYPVIECTGGGRCFTKGDKYDHVYNKTLLKEIEKVES